MEQTASGLIVPDGTVEKKKEVFEPYETEAIKKCAEVLMRHDAKIACICGLCQLNKSPNPLFSIEVDEEGRMVLECNCRTIRLKRRRGKKVGVS